MTGIAAQANPFVEFRALYERDSVRFVREVLGRELYADQVELLRAYDRGDRQIAKRSGHGVGKTTGVAWLVVHHILFRFRQKTVCTAASSSQLFDALASEVKDIISGLPPHLQELIEVQVEGIFLRAAPDKSFISFKTSKAETPEAMAGVHSDHVLLICDEASGIPEQVYEAGYGSMSGHNACTILLGNPVRTSGTFFDAFHKNRGEWTTFHTPCVNPDGTRHPNVTQDYIDKAKKRWGEDSNAYRVRVLGDFPTADEDTVIPFELMEAALHRDVKATMVRDVWGVDCARFGSDSSALARRRGNTLTRKVEEKKGWDVMRLTGWIKSEWDACPESERPTDINVDSIGIGAGLCDRLMELGLPARGINVAESPAIFVDSYGNLRAELWFKGKEWLAQKDCHLGGDEELGAELVGPRFKYRSDGKILVESKDDMKKRGVRSPNKADAFLLTMASNSVSAISGSKNSTSWTQPLKRRIAGIV